MADIRQDQIGVRGKLFRCGRSGQHRDPPHARHARGFQIMNAIADHREGGGRQAHMRRKGVQLPRRGLAPVPTVEPCDEVEHINHPRRQQMCPRRVFRIVRRHAEPKTPVAEPLQKRSERHRLALRRAGRFSIDCLKKIRRPPFREMRGQGIDHLLRRASDGDTLSKSRPLTFLKSNAPAPHRAAPRGLA